MTKIAPALLVAAALGFSPYATGQGLPDSFVDKLSWRCIGPANMGGRVVDLEVVESDPTTFWVVTASAGLLKTTNNGMTFEHQFDHEEVVSIGDAAVAPSNPEIVWVGTGENNPRNSVSYGNGVYKSVDGGKTWKHMGLKESFQTGKICIHPKNPDVVYVGALGRLWGPNEARGVFKTTDGGETWEKVLYLDDKHRHHRASRCIRTIPTRSSSAAYERQRASATTTNDPEVKFGREAAGSTPHDRRRQATGSRISNAALPTGEDRSDRTRLELPRQPGHRLRGRRVARRSAMEPEKRSAGTRASPVSNADVGRQGSPASSTRVARPPRPAVASRSATSSSRSTTSTSHS